MSQFAIITNSTIDETEEYYQTHQLGYAPLSYTIGGRTIIEDCGKSMSGHAFYEQLRQGNMCTTSQTPVETYHGLYRAALEQGLDVLYVGFSSGISGSYQAGCIAAQDLAPQYPQRKILCVDTLSATGGMHILVDEAVAMRDAGASIEDTMRKIEEMRLHIVHLIIPDDLKHLYRGGRLSRSSAVLGSLVGIKPVIAFTDEGKLAVMTKVRGRTASLEYGADHMAKEVTDRKQTVWISHADCLQDAEQLRGYIQDKYGMHAEIRMLGTVLGAHGGPGTIILCYQGQGRAWK